MNHSQWKTRRTRRLLGEETEPSQAYKDAGAAFELGQAVYDRRIHLELSQTRLAKRASMTQAQISRIEQGDVPKLPLLRRLAAALEVRLQMEMDGDNVTFTLTPLKKKTATARRKSATPAPRTRRERVDA